MQKLHGFGSQFNDVTLHGQNHSGKLSAQFIAKAINGELTWLPQGQGKLIGRFKNISLGENNQKSATENDLPDVTLSQQLKNSTIPNVDLQIEQLTYHGHPLGRIELNANQIGQDILLNNLRISNSDGTLIGNGKWSLQPAQVHLALKLDMQDAGGLLTRLGYPNSMDNGEGNLASDLVWAGGPDELALANLEGNVSLKLNDGQFLQLDSGAAKLLSVFSLQSLPKRITLDFNDIFSNGFAFDHMEGQAQIRRGILVTQKLNLHSSAAEVSMSGQVDLNHETQSLRVKVLPTIGNSVSLLAFAAGPIVGTGVFLANKLLSAPLDQLVSFEYDISGSWSEPKVNKVIRKIPE